MKGSPQEEKEGKAENSRGGDTHTDRHAATHEQERKAKQVQTQKKTHNKMMGITCSAVPLQIIIRAKLSAERDGYGGEEGRGERLGDK